MKHTIIKTLLALAIVLPVRATETVEHTVDNLPVLGTLAPDATKQFSRLPDSLKGKVRDDLWALGLHSAGLSIRFRSDASTLKARWKSLNKFSMNHMTPTGIRGLDLYVMDTDSTWTPLCSGRPSLASATSTSTFATGMEPRMREYMLYLPLYDGLDSLVLITDSAARVLPPVNPNPVRERPLVMYGTSILQGGCATRPGMVHTNILQRRLGRVVVNLGFSGNARLDPEIAQLMARADAGAYVIDPLPNCTPEQVSERMDSFLDILRASHPTTPILLVESPIFPIARFVHDTDSVLKHKNDVLREIYTRRHATDPELYYFESSDVLSDPENTVDNYHMTDQGFRDFADRLEKVLRPMISKKD